jgi:hypothetical protein
MIAAILAGDIQVYHQLIRPYELNINETPEALNISIVSVKVRLHCARMMLQNSWPLS